MKESVQIKIKKLKRAKTIILVIGIIVMVSQFIAQIFSAFQNEPHIIWFCITVLHRIGILLVLTLGISYVIEGQIGLLEETDKLNK